VTRKHAFIPLALVILACSAPGRHSSSSRSSIVVGTAVDMTGVNQLVGSHTRFSQDVIDLLFLRLFLEQPDFADHPPTFLPQLVKDHSWSDDNLSLRIELRDDVLWSDGVPLTAEDVAWTFKAQTDPDVAWGYSHSKRAVNRVEARGPQTVVFHFTSVYPSRLADINEGVVLPKHAWGRLPFDRWRGNADWFRRHLVVNGPYDLATWEPHHEIVLERNPRYFRRQRPKLDHVVFRVIPHSAHRFRQLLSGEIDFVEQIRAADQGRLEASNNARPISYWHRQYTHIVWNACQEPFSDPRVRLALTLGIDRHHLVESLFGNAARIGITPVPQSVWAFDTEILPWPHSPARARRLLADAGWVDSDDDGVLDKQGRPLSFELSTNSDNQVRLDAAMMIQSQLAEIGVDARVLGLEFNTLVDRNIEHDFDATIGAWGIDTTLDLRYAFHSSSRDSGYNYGCFSDPEVDRLIGEIRRQPTFELARPLLHDLQRIIHEQQPYTFLWEPRRTDGAAIRLRGLAPNLLSAYYNLEEWWVESEGI